MAVLWGGSAWTAENSDFDQALLVDLGTVKNITGIATQGRAHSDEYVQEFRIQYGSNGKDFIGKKYESIFCSFIYISFKKVVIYLCICTDVQFICPGHKDL